MENPPPLPMNSWGTTETFQEHKLIESKSVTNQLLLVYTMGNGISIFYCYTDFVYYRRQTEGGVQCGNRVH
ncbi:hypothetical protein XELAEV_18000125mg [Xenopus laevis]|uniref:Uncharacterized protein n=1 Tax=Xenopus laevis TaxID=8355 RepID=A0A974BQU8_XENLA|nr:hypothetical protein XELAEV_18000125mg [Xenopus laevis]